MKVKQINKGTSVVRPVGEMPAGTAVLNGEGNLCLVCRSEGRGADGRIRIVNLELGGIYTVLPTCRYEEVDAEVVWTYKGK